MSDDRIDRAEYARLLGFMRLLILLGSVLVALAVGVLIGLHWK